MSDTIIQVDNVWKKYQLGVVGTGTLSHDLNRWWHRVRGKPDPYAKVGEAPKAENRKEKTEIKSDEIWALRGVSFEVRQGEILGIIGRNGAGKSTLLKILSRTTAPTSGEIRVKGRIASLLEVGTGFHPELTGRENIFLNGAILGMTKAEIRKKFDEIVAFSEVEQFIDTPVKRYSSGMYVRLAFAVAAHLEPEILIIDEVLAVGDAQFQRKCLGKMGDVAKQGRTILFVSHNMAAVSHLCTKALVLANGAVMEPLGGTGRAISSYMGEVEKLTRIDLKNRIDRQGKRGIIITDFRLTDDAGRKIDAVRCGETFQFRIPYLCPSADRHNVEVSITITGSLGVNAWLSNGLYNHRFEVATSNGYFCCRIRRCPFYPGDYHVNIMVRSQQEIEDWVTEAGILRIEYGDFFGSGRLPPESHGGQLVEQEWNHAKEDLCISRQ